MDSVTSPRGYDVIYTYGLRASEKTTFFWPTLDGTTVIVVECERLTEFVTAASIDVLCELDPCAWIKLPAAFSRTDLDSLAEPGTV